MRKTAFLALLAILIVLVSTTHGDAKPYYEGKVIKIIVATKPGGGYDFWARLIGTYMEKNLPGSTIIVKNVPGAGHVIGTNETYMAKPDGLTIGTFNRAVGLTQLVGMKGVKFDFTKFNWLGSPNSEIYSFLVRSDLYKNIDDVLKADNVRLATTGLGAISYITPLLFYQALGKKNYTVATGYSGAESEMAVMRKEMDGTWGSIESLKTMLDGGFGTCVLLIGKKQPAGLENVPLLKDFIKDEKNRPVVELLNGLNIVGRPFAAPPKVPEDRLKILQDAFYKACHDPGFIKAVQKSEKTVDFVGPDEVDAWAKSMLSLPPETVKLIKKAYGIE
ncbi:MAG: tripartite tricarboxylate transporter substrate-binding protein [Thermodesulfobacteriota bacterium]